MSSTSPPARRPSRGFASNELLIVIAVTAMGLAVALPVVLRSYPYFLSRCAAAGQSVGWPQHLQATGFSALMVAAVGVVLYLALAAITYGGELGVGVWRQFTQAVTDLKDHWKDGAG